MKHSSFTRAVFVAAVLFLNLTAVLHADIYGVSGRRGAVIKGDDHTVVVRRPAPRAVVVTPHTTTVVTTLPRGYVRVVPTGYTRVVYSGYNCYFVGGVYYRSVIYQGETVFVVVH